MDDEKVYTVSLQVRDLADLTDAEVFSLQRFVAARIVQRVLTKLSSEQAGI